MTTNQWGSLVETTTYDPWGEVLSGGTQSKFLYTGQEHDTETGLHYYNARYYNPDIRRFAQPDEVIQNVYDPQFLNRYSYVRNNPIRYTDPTGNISILDYNHSLNQYHKKPGALSYNNVLNVMGQFAAVSGNKAQGSSTSSTNNKSGGNNTAAAIVVGGGIAQNRAGGLTYQKQALAEYGFQENRQLLTDYRTRPDILTDDVVGDCKRVKYLCNTQQIRNIIDLADATDRKCVIICPIQTDLSKPLQQNLERLGKKGDKWDIIRFGSMLGARAFTVETEIAGSLSLPVLIQNYYLTNSQLQQM